MTSEEEPEKPPEPPLQESCCRRGCELCIFDYYDRMFAAWEDRTRAAGRDPVT